MLTEDGLRVIVQIIKLKLINIDSSFMFFQSKGGLPPAFLLLLL